MKAGMLAVAVLLAACQLPPSGIAFRTTVAQPNGSYPIPVVLGDLTGLVEGIEPVFVEGVSWDLPSVNEVPGDSQAVLLAWGTGACDDDVGITFRRSEAGFRITIEVYAGFSLGCTAQLLFRQMLIRLKEPVRVDSIAVSGGG